ncbi:MAG: peptide chain release factor N(5)-glutamine methyltransferase [Acidimicrobiia bacterium]|nr:peptide chain release factor N(5)-glutamine methyltransferase [Acidimicrobiia bacterium]
MPTLHELVANSRRRLYDAGIPQAEADLDARLILEHLVHWDTARFFAHGEQQANADVVQRYEACIERRVRREPTAYIIGEREFWGLPFEVTPAVLIPRPETELIVEIALERYPIKTASLEIADACTGSGCLAIALALERPAARIVATDTSRAALEVATRNAARHQVLSRVRFEHADLLAVVPGSFDLIVSNPPYVAANDASTLQPEVLGYEPRMALFAGMDGLDVIRSLVSQAAERLRAGGLLVFEFGYGQTTAIRKLLADTSGLTLVDVRNDLQGVPRTGIARRE